MNKERINDLVDILGDEYAQLENTFVIRNQQELGRYLDNPVEWKSLQLKHREKFKTILIKDARAKLKQLNAKTEKVFLLSYREVAKDQVKITKNEIIAENIPKNVRQQIKALKKFNAEQIINLANQTLLTHEQDVQIVSSLSTPDNLYNAVKEQMKKGIDKGVKIQYVDGKQFTWKAYMEMNIRTTIHQEMSQNQVNAGAKVGQVFYICDTYADCADDHAPYQGKIYFNSQVILTPEIQDFINKNNIMSMQEVMGEPYYLTTRPNCRHNFHAIPLAEAMKLSKKDILNKYNLSTGKYKKSNYEKLQKQRYNERMIRKYKLRKESNEQMSKTLNDKSIKYDTNDNRLISKWQKKNRDLIASNQELLKRDYDRENAKVITQDLGVRYDYKFKEGQAIPK